MTVFFPDSILINMYWSKTFTYAIQSFTTPQYTITPRYTSLNLKCLYIGVLKNAIGIFIWVISIMYMQKNMVCKVPQF